MLFLVVGYWHSQMYNCQFEAESTNSVIAGDFKFKTLIG